MLFYRAQIRGVKFCKSLPSLPLDRTLLNKVAEILPGELKNVAPEDTYNVGKHPESAALTVSGGTVTVSVTLTSPLMRETPKATAAAGDFVVSLFLRWPRKG